jgi:hypothetical protein
MKKYNFFHYGVAISKSQFIANVPENWEDEVIDGEYNWGGYKSILRD